MSMLLLICRTFKRFVSDVKTYLPFCFNSITINVNCFFLNEEYLFTECYLSYWDNYYS